MTSSNGNDSPHEGQWCEALIFSLICAWINGWVVTWDSLWRHCNDYVVNLRNFYVYLMIRSWHAKFATGCPITIWALKQNGKLAEKCDSRRSIFNSLRPGGLVKMGHFYHHFDVIEVLAISRRFGGRLWIFIGAHGLLRVLTFNF